MRGTIDGIEVYLPEDQLPAFTISAGGISDPSLIKGTKSSTLRVIATAESRRALGTESMAEERRTNRPELRIGEDEGDLFRAEVIPVSHDRNVIECFAGTGNATWFDLAKAQKIRELDLGESDPIDATVQADTWTDLDSTLYFPLVDFGNIEGRANTYDIGVTRLRPGVRMHVPLDAAFQSWGYTIRPMGRLADVWKKFILFNPRTKIAAGPTPLLANVATFAVTTAANAGAAGPGYVAYTLAATVLTDPGSRYVSPGRYDSALDGTIKPTVTVNVTATGTLLYAQIRVTNTSVGGFIRYGAQVPLVSGVSQDITADLGDLPIVTGDEVEVAVLFYGSSTQRDINGGTLTFTPTDALYGAGMTILMGDPLPDMSVAEVLQALASIKCLAFHTVRREVQVWFDNEFYRRPGSPLVNRDWTTRMDHTTAPAKVFEDFPRELSFKWKEDSKDRDLKLLDQKYAGGYGNATLLFPQCYGKEKEIKIPFAATAMENGLEGSVFIPVSRKEGGTYQVDDYDRAPRILIADGMSIGDWVHDGGSLTEYPKCYFACGNAVDEILASGNAAMHGDTRKGAAYTDWSFRLQRNSAPALECSMMVRDWELQDFDHGVPTRADDGHSELWYYVHEVRNHRFGKGIPSRCLLVPIPSFEITVPTPGVATSISDPDFDEGDLNSAVLHTRVRSDGRILVGGVFTAYGATAANRFTLLNSNGTLNTAFNTAMGAGPNGQVRRFAIDSAGRAVIVGTFTTVDGVARSHIARINTDGTLDLTFDPGAGFNSSLLDDIVILGSGVIVAVGGFITYDGTASNRIIGLNPDGTIHTAFNVGSGFNSAAERIALCPDGTVIVSSRFFSAYNGTSVTGGTAKIVRINPNGSLNAIVTQGTHFNDSIRGITVMGNGWIVVTGEFTDYNGTTLGCIARLTAAGALDTTFVAGGGAGFNDWTTTSLVLPSGKIIVGIYTTASTTYDGTNVSGLARLNNDGTLDTLFNTGGGFDGEIMTLARDGTDVIVGGNFTNVDGDPRKYVARIIG